ncbi:MAG: zinc-binding dehydrogenase [Dermabacter sp.]|nr:zinc-binding dehydrogenase [Dermabacter sp.]
MKALRVHSKENLSLDEVLTPTPGDGQVLIRMAYAGICGSDLHYYFDGANGAFVVKEPLIPGHEVSGTVEADPSGRLAPGTPVTVHPARFGTPDEAYGRHLWPGGSYLGSASTWPHTQGGMSEYLLVEDFMVVQIPDGLSLEAAALAEPLAVGLHGINRAGDLTGQKVLVSGSGPIGLLAAAGALSRGAAEVWATDLLDGPLARADALGVHRTVRVDQEALPEHFFDVVLECTGIPAAVNAAFEAARRGGTLVQIGMMGAGPQPIALATAIAKEVSILPSFRFDDEIGEALDILRARPEIADIVVTHVVSADDAEQAFALARNSAESGKVLVDLWTEAGQSDGS